jgi:predicted Zn finger-like uncharacterized protein
MFNSSQLGDIMETSCRQCNARYRVTDEQLKIAAKSNAVSAALYSMHFHP